MNKIFITFLISMFLPAFAACPIDANQPCTGENQDIMTISQINNSNQDLRKEENNYPFLPENERTSNPFDDTQNQSYDPDCMFGVCLP